MKKLLNVLKYILFYGIGVALLWLALRGLSWREIISGLKNANYFFVLLALAISLLSHYFRAMRWNLLIEPLDHKVSGKNSFIAVLFGYMVNFALPRMGEISRCVILNRSDKIPLNKLIGTVLIERVFDMFILLVLLVLTFFLEFRRLKDFLYEYLYFPLQNNFNDLSLVFWLSVMGILIILLALLILSVRFIRRNSGSSKFIGKIHEMLSGFYSGIKTIIHMEKKWRFIIFTTCIWACYFLMTYLMFFSIPMTSTLGLGAALSALTIGSIGMVIPSPGGMGSWHYAVVLTLGFYKPLSMPAADWYKASKLYTLITHESQMIFLILAGAIAYLIFMANQKNVKSHETA